MEFEEMTKIWDQQTKKTMFVINEKALNNRIKAKLRGSERMNNINDFGLIAISICTAAMVLIIKTISTWNLVTAVILLLISFYIIANRLRREKRSRQFDLSLLGGVNHAIENINFEIRRSKTFILWFLLPLSVPSFMNLAQKEASIWIWLLVIGGFFLAYFVTRLGLQRSLIPKKRNLEILKEKLLEAPQDI
ncbi:hypothetical protein [Marivirga lumbricoides]